MNCKNCNNSISSQNKFCNECGAKVVKERITLKNLLSDVFANAFGWDNKYFVTVKNLIVSPHVVFHEYINGTRKKYVNPFAFFAIGAAITVVVLNFFAEDYLRLSSNMNQKQIEIVDEVVVSEEEDLPKKAANDSDVRENKVLSSKEFKDKQAEISAKLQKGLLKYFNLVSFVFLPVYAFIAFLVFWKPYNYGEHLVINGYIQGITFLFTTALFLISLFINPVIYNFVVVSTIGYYTYAYTRLYRLSFGKIIVRLLKFVVIIAITFFIFVLIGFVFGNFILATN